MEDLQRQIEELTRLVEQIQKGLNIALALLSILVGAVIGYVVGIIVCKVIDEITSKKKEKKQPILVDKLRGNMNALAQYMNYHPNYSFKLAGKYSDDEYILEVYKK